ncbi:anaphase-promoting complex subunit 2 [Phragmites australis]|uniref:anaphase-promoting complex subunit 2 n=1 Tax=Phragmites australis TaxID=29695 RepID=UPI002D77E5DA|nr:anaphase-promoting complex subunit 2 [Phragmites australis]XP_062189674.1 anaphase-promoting complex subunit 2 [Phragmites australis]
MQLDAAADGALDSWAQFCSLSGELVGGDGELSVGPCLAPVIADLCARGLATLLRDYFLHSLEETFRNNAVKNFWQHFHPYCNSSAVDRTNFCVKEHWPEEILSTALEDICMEKSYQEKCVLVLVHALQSYEDRTPKRRSEAAYCSSSLIPRYQLMVSSVLLTTLPMNFPEILNVYFKKKLEELNTIMAGSYESDQLGSNDLFERSNTSAWHSGMDIDGQETVVSENNYLVKNIGKVVRDLRSLGFTSMTENAYSSAIIWLLKSKVYELAGDDYRIPVLGCVKKWIRAVPLRFLHALLTYLGDYVDYDSESSGLKSPLASRPSSFPGIGVPSEALVRWHMRLEYFAYETLQDLRIGKLFEIIVDYPESSPAIEDLKLCLEYTGQHSKLVDSFISSLRYRLLTAGASTNDILHQYMSTIKALRTIDPTGVFLEAVGEPIRDYLRGRKDTIKCIVTMLTDGSGGNGSGTGNAGDNLLEELNRDAENQDNADYDDHTNIDEKQAWLNSESWEPDPIEADPLKGSRNRRKVDILGLMVSIIGSKDQLVNEYRVMLAEKLLNKSDFDIDSDIRTLELLKIHFGESSMQKCEIMLNDLIDSKRTNSNIKTSLLKTSQIVPGQEETEMSHDVLDATIISSNFWPPIQTEDLAVPASVDQLMSDYAKRFHQIKTPRKLLWKKNLGTVKLELQFEDRSMQFTVAPVHAAIIMQFQEKSSWTLKALATEIGIPVESLNRKISFWTSKGVLTESVGPNADDRTFTVVDSMPDVNKNNTANERLDEYQITEEGESSVVSVEEQLKKEMTVYEKFIIGMLTNFGSMTLDRIHNTLKMFCIAEPSYDKSLQQLQSFLSGLVSDEKLEMRDGSYLLKR